MATAASLTLASGVAGAAAAHPVPDGAGGYPERDAGYHDYGEMVAEITQAAVDHPDIVRLTTIGTSWQGRDLHLVKITDQPDVDEGEPEVLVDALHHAREHLTPEMALSIVESLTDGYASGDARIRGLVDSRVIWIVPMLDPDGLVWDLGRDPYRGWRKNRQPNDAGEPKGTDLNRNYGFHWGGAGASTDPGSDIYRGPAPWSAPETAVIRDFVLSRVIDGRQRIGTHVSLHTAGEYVVYPYGYASADLPPTMTEIDHQTLVAMATELAATNGYTPIRSGDWYLHSGTMVDWMYGTQRVFSFTLELYPADRSDPDRSYPPDEVIAAETSRNREAMLRVIEYADCPYAAIGKERMLCGPMFDDLEVDEGWTVDPEGTDTATAGAWDLGNPQGTDALGPKQMETAWSGRWAYVTGLLGDACPACNDVDGGATSVRSRRVELPAGQPATLRLRYALGHNAGAGPADGLRISVVADGSATSVASMLGDGSDRDAAWQRVTVDLSPWAGETIAIEVIASDVAEPSLVEVAFDQVRITND